tara:strand:- start:121 stop:279 length:159 start_codon:yes stop_codon:yes gene_type:complete
MFNHTKEHPNDAALILVSRRFAEMVGLEADDFIATTKNVEAHGGRMEFTINK